MAVRTGLASYAFFCGAVLLGLGGVPVASPTGRRMLQETVPLALVEFSDGLRSCFLGFLLIVMSRGLARGYRSLAPAVGRPLLAAALTTFLKGLDYEEALLAPWPRPC